MRKPLLGLIASVLLAVPAAAQPVSDQREVASRYGLTSPQAREVLARVDSLASEIQLIANANRIQRDTLRAIAISLGSEGRLLSAEDLLRLIARKAADAARAQEKIRDLGAALEALDPGEVRTRAIEVLSRARRKFADGKLAEAEAAFGELELLRSVDLTNTRRAWREAVYAQAQVAALDGHLERASALYDRAANDLLRRAGEAELEAWSFQMASARQWYERGEIFGDRTALARTLAIYRDKALPLAPRDRAPILWGVTQRNIGAALVQLASRETEPAGFDEAMEAFRLAGQVLTRERTPLEWAVLQSSIGGHYLRLAERNHSSDFALASASAYEASLSVITREEDPALWAATQDNLGNAYLLAGKERDDPAYLGKSAAAYRKALQIRNREQAPVEWALTQINYGAAVMLLARQSGDVGGLKEAEEGLAGAVAIFSPERTPQWWAMAQHNLGNVQAALGDLAGDAIAGQQAVTTFRSVLAVRNKADVPFDWAQTNASIATTLLDLGNAAESISYFRDALQVFTRAAMPENWAAMQHNLGIALAIEGGAARDPAQLEQAIGALEAALEVQTREQDPRQWIDGSVNIAAAEATIAGLTSDRKLLKAARRRAASARASAKALGDASLVAFADEAMSHIDTVARRLKW